MLMGQHPRSHPPRARRQACRLVRSVRQQLPVPDPPRPESDRNLRLKGGSLRPPRTWVFLKSKLSNRYFSQVLGYELTLAEDTDHKRQQRILGPFLTRPESLANLLPICYDTAQQMRDMMRDSAGPINIDDFTGRCTMDVSGRVAFGRELNALTAQQQDSPGIWRPHHDDAKRQL